MFTYLLINLGSVLVPFLFSFHPRLNFYKRWHAFIPANLLTGAFFIIWDSIFTQLGVWSFNPDYVLGIYLLSLPVEEWLFFLCIPYACVFSYHCFNILIQRDFLAPYARRIAWALVFLLLLIGALNYGRFYTSVTFILCAAFLFLHLRVFRSDYLGRFFFAYAIMLIPFFIVNGMLTGSWIGREVVRYNDAENLGMRLLTIPVEDTVYGLLMILMNITIYETIARRKVHAQGSADPLLSV